MAPPEISQGGDQRAGDAPPPTCLGRDLALVGTVVFVPALLTSFRSPEVTLTTPIMKFLLPIWLIAGKENIPVLLGPFLYTSLSVVCITGGFRLKTKRNLNSLSFSPFRPSSFSGWWLSI